MALTRIKTNQLTDLAVTNPKIANATIEGGKLANNITYGSDFTVSGNLTVSGTTTSVSTTNTRVDDAILALANGTSGAPSEDAGLLINRGSSDNQAFIWDESEDKFVFANVGAEDGDTAGNLTIASYAPVQMAALASTSIDASGVVTITDNTAASNASTGALIITGGVGVGGAVHATGGFDGDLTGNADTATALATARAIAIAGDVVGTANFDGTGDKMILPHSELQQLNTGQFTVELFVYFTSTNQRQGFFGNDTGWYFQIYDGELEFALSVSAVIERSFSHSINQWYHLAATRDSSNDIRLFIDGTQQGAVVNSTANLSHASNNFHIGNIGPATSRLFKGGYMDEIRITKGVARYNSNFTVPTKAFANR